MTVLCGGIPTRAATETLLRLDVDAPEGSPERVNLNIDQITRPMVANVGARLLDLLEIAAYVYAADQFVRRGGAAMVGMGRDWRRDFRFSIPVRDLTFWRHRETQRRLVETLSFLSDDDYQFRFVPAARPRPFDSYLDLNGEGAPVGFTPDRVALFSGGLDSLAGVASSALQRSERIALVSHHASTMIQARQAELVESLRARLPPGRLFHVGITVTKGQEEASEFTQRTRSFLFASLAFVVAHLFAKQEVTFYENGVVSLNLPVAEHVLGSRATRTTHPRVLNDVGRLFSHVASAKIGVCNPYFWSTKAEVLRKLADAGCADLVARSFSCSHVRLSTRLKQQCGTCTQCLDRRFAVLAAGLEADDPADGYAVDLLSGRREPGEEATLAESYVLSALRYEAMTETAFFSRFGQVFRALPYLEGKIEQNAVRVHELHQRHGRAVRLVIDRAVRASSINIALERPESSLLSLLQAPFGSPAVINDPVASEPPITEQVKALTGPPPVARPIVLAVDQVGKRIIIANEIVITGASFRFLATLVDPFLNDLVARKPRDSFQFTATHRLSKTLEIEGHAIRQRVLRIRQHLAAAFLERLGMSVEDSDVVENRGNGYRLNPYLALQSAADDPFATRSAADVTPFVSMSQDHPETADSSPS